MRRAERRSGPLQDLLGRWHARKLASERLPMMMILKNSYNLLRSRCMRWQVKSGALFVIVFLWIASMAFAASRQNSLDAICDTSADFSLGTENYPEAIRLHLQVLRRNPNSALAHYHLGFAQGMIGNRSAELREYERAEALGLRNWDLFLNLGLAQLENGNLEAATDSLRNAVSLGKNHWESHFNLGLVYERRAMLASAEHEMLAALRLNPWEPDTLNLLGVVYAREGKIAHAFHIWSDLAREAPGYEPARKNLATLGNQTQVVPGLGDRCASLSDRREAIERENHLPICQMRLGSSATR